VWHRETVARVDLLSGRRVSMSGEDNGLMVILGRGFPNFPNGGITELEKNV
jgi:hypothetical protein